MEEGNKKLDLNLEFVIKSLKVSRALQTSSSGSSHLHLIDGGWMWAIFKSNKKSIFQRNLMSSN